MIPKLALIFGLALTTTCMVLPQIPIHLPLLLPYHVDPNYSFSYEVNDERTGDIKNQHESRNGGTVVGQYSLVQPDGFKRIVDYRADDYLGFTATVNNERVVDRQQDNDAKEESQNKPAQEPQWPQTRNTSVPASVDRSRPSVSHTINGLRVPYNW